MSQDLPFSAEYAKSGRSKCKTCGSQIPKDHIRIAVMVQSAFFDGKEAQWNHFNCFFRKRSVKSTGDIKGFGTLRYEDQAKIKEKVGGLVKTGKGKAVTKEVFVEYAKSNRSSCKGCFSGITKDSVRVGCWVDAEGAELKWAVNGKKQAWHHPSCFVDRRGELGHEGVGADLADGFQNLKEEDRAQLILLLGKGSRKRKRAGNENIPPAKNSHDKKLQAQSDYLVSIRSALKELPNKYLREMLEVNGYPTHGLDIRLVDRCSDGIAFGRFDDPCPLCEGEYFSLGDGTYLCKGDVSEYTKCTRTIKEPKRRPWILTEKVKEQSDYLGTLKLRTGTRLFNEVAQPSFAAGGSTDAAKPLQGYVFFSNMDEIEMLGNPQPLKTVLQSYGGKLMKKFAASCNAVIFEGHISPECGEKMVKRAIQLELPIVEPGKLAQALTSGSITDLSGLCHPGYDGEDYVAKRRKINAMKKSARREEASSGPKQQKIRVQNGAEVFAESGLQDDPTVKVYKDHMGVVYAVTLGYVDISAGKNSYYKLQVLQTGPHKFELFRAWGRIGVAGIGGTSFDNFVSPVGATELFRSLYAEKSGNEWGEPFVKRPGKMARMDVDYGQEEVEEQGVKPGSLTTLDKAVQGLITLIFDINAMKKTLLEFEIDLNKMPLGKISKSQIREAFSVLTATLEYLKEGNSIQILDASTRFYTLIPHDFGMATPPLLDSEELIGSKAKMLETLLELEIAYSMTKVGSVDKDCDPIDVHYRKLKSDIAVVNPSSDEFGSLQEYVSSTHAATHSAYSLEIGHIFKVTREGEEARYQEFSTLHNRMLLWHGSRISNFAGILSQGLRIAPPEAPVTGYMFGKGLYFADMVSKSANYCGTSPSNNTGLLLLCEVALGDMFCLDDALYIKRLPRNKHSTKGCGKTAPASSVTLENGCVMPLGPGVEVPGTEGSALLYNEYIVYNVAQVRVKYLLQINFNYNN